MKAVAGAIVVLAGAVLAGASIVSITLAAGMRDHHPAEGYVGVLAGGLLTLIGLSILATGIPLVPPDSRAQEKP
jgi:hypothetical protein